MNGRFPMVLISARHLEKKVADVQIQGNECGLGAVAREAVEQSRAIRPGREIEMEQDEGRIMIVVKE